MTMRLTLAGLAASVAVLAAAPAIACLPATYPAGTTAEGRARIEVERQQKLWRETDIVFVATVVGRTPVRSGPWGRLERLQVHPERVLKGVLPPQDFDLVQTGMTDCGPAPFFDIFDYLDRDEDGVFVVFIKGPYPAQEAVLNTLAVGRVTAPEMRTLLDGLGYPSR